jgi:vanillate O-demethylase ferredoxin subunit
VFALVLLLGGLLVWRPSRRAARHALSLHPRLPGRAYAISLHKTMALYAGPILLFSALTGVMQAFEWPQTALLAITGSAPAAGSGKSRPAPALRRRSIDSAWQTAQSMVPDPQRALILAPKRPADPVRFELIGASAPHSEARSELSIDAYSGAVLRFAPYAEASLGQRLLLWLVALHTGQLGGIAGQLLLICGALSVPVLGYAGLRSYLLGRRRARSGSV